MPWRISLCQGQIPKDSGLGQGDMPEQGHPRIGPFFFDHPREEGKVIILDENPRVQAALQLFQGRLGEFPVHRFILAPVLGPEGRAGVGDVTEGPKAFVRESVIIPLLLLLGKPDPLQEVLRVIRGNPDLVLIIHDFPVGVPAPMGHPGSAAGLENRLQGRHQAAGGDHAFDLLSTFFMHVGFPVGKDQEGPSPQEVAHMFPQPRGGPEGLGLAPQPGLLFRGRPRFRDAFHHPGGLAGQGFKDLSGRRGQGEVSLFGPQAFHPFGHLGNGVDHAPANHQKGGQRNEEGAHQKPDEIILPDEGHSILDLFGLIDHHHGPGGHFFMIEGESIEIHILPPEREKSPLFQAVVHDVPDERRRVFQMSSQARAGGHELVLGIVDRHSGQPFPIAEFFDDRLETLDLALGKQRFDAFFQALAENGRPPFQIEGHALFFLPDLQNREEKDDEADHYEKGKDDPKSNAHRSSMLSTDQRKGFSP
jgi:hypothetical protein